MGSVVLGARKGDRGDRELGLGRTGGSVGERKLSTRGRSMR